MPNTEWRAIPGFPNYAVSCRGEVRSVPRNKLLAQVEGKRGYLLVTLYKDGRPKNCLVHRLVAASHIGPIPDGWQVNHKDGNKRNNDVANLEIVTAEQNLAHALTKGLLRRGEGTHTAKLKEGDVKEIRRERAAGVSVRTLANRYDVSERCIYLLTRRLTWAHVP